VFTNGYLNGFIYESFENRPEAIKREIYFKTAATSRDLKSKTSV